MQSVFCDFIGGERLVFCCMILIHKDYYISELEKMCFDGKYFRIL